MCQLGAALGYIVVYWVHMHHADMAEACQHQYVLMARVCPLDDQLHPACSPAARAPEDHCCGADLVESSVQQLSAASGTVPECQRACIWRSEQQGPHCQPCLVARAAGWGREDVVPMSRG